RAIRRSTLPRLQSARDRFRLRATRSGTRAQSPAQPQSRKANLWTCLGQSGRAREERRLALLPSRLVLALADFLDGVRDVFFHPAMLVFVRGGDGFVHLMDRFDALAALVVPGTFKMMPGFLKVLDG